MIRVAIVDDQALVRAGFRMILDAQPDIEVVAEASNGRESLRVCRETRPDVVLMDVRMPEMDGLEATRHLLADPGLSVRVLVLTTFDLDEYVYQALHDGASGFLLKESRPEALADAVRTVARGEDLLAPQITRRLIAQFVRRPPASSAASRTALAELTEREVEVLRLITRGRSNSEIAAELFLAEATVKTHVSRFFAKLGVRDRAQAVIAGYETGLVEVGSA